MCNFSLQIVFRNMLITCNEQKNGVRISKGKYYCVELKPPFLRRWYIRIYFTLVVSKYAELKTLVLDTINPDWEISISTMDIFNFLHNPFWVPTNESSLIDYAQNFTIITFSDKTVQFLQSTIFCLHNIRNWVFATLIF